MFVRKATGLVRTAGWLTTCSLTFMYLTSGIPMYPFQAIHWFPGANIPLSYAFGFGIMVWPAFVIMFLTVAMPRTSSDYVAVSRILNPMLGFMGIGLQWINLIWVFGAVALFAIWYFGAAFSLLGTIMHQTGLLSLGTLLTEYGNPYVIAVTIILCVLLAILVLAGMKWVGYIQNTLFILSMIGVVAGVAVVAYFSFAGTAASQAAWDVTYGAGAWQEVIDVAVKNGYYDHVAAATGNPEIWGWPGKWDFWQTGQATMLACYAIWGWEISNIAAGEIKEPSRNYPIGILVSFVITLVWYMSVMYWIYSAYAQFIPMYNYITMGGYRDQLTINPGAEPSLFFYEASLVGSSPILAAIIILAQNIGIMLGACVSMMVLCSRIMFAWAFDRVIPTVFARVNDRWHTPHWSILFVFIIGVVFIIASAYAPYLMAVNVYALAGFRYLVIGWAGTIYPYRRPEVFERAFPWKVAGVPVVSICGVLATLSGGWLLLTNLFIIPAEEHWSKLLQVFLFSVVAVWWAVYYIYNKSKGIDMDALYREIPPA